ncbi:type II toxin-antitoxin system VapC family toxin [Burkholderia multivorans]|uniref:Ribonuclease VapC n=1 Tax=Burkholderia multivorans TaxID=87883 RepID=A0AB37AR93_9BURK|nr:type II toxin-antitoxin system VapC family toxin [Burkholderia multivorans]PRE45501.1 VapC toxin family PIN domain ribonuclease [Burkholderia multivorans]PRE52190.1 VapC toxin family PIN domain ribonuclease [Burkholderia multivorans]
MIILDTNVLSEALRPTPNDVVMAWLDAQPRSSLFTTAITRAEIFYGLGLLPDGSRRHQLTRVVEVIFDEDFAGRVLGFDSDAADAYATIAVARRSAGRSISQFDAMIAATAQSRGAALATRNVKDFTDCGISVIDPWVC